MLRACVLAALLAAPAVATVAALPCAGALPPPCVEWARLEQGIWGALEPGTHVIEDEATWLTFWAPHGASFWPPKPAPKVDFSTRFVVALVDHHTDCCDHRVHVLDVLHVEGRYQVVFDHTEGWGGADALTRPHDVLALARVAAGSPDVAFVGRPPNHCPEWGC